MIPKDFQQATADRIVEVFRSGQNRILLADEVGLGKTIIASDVVRQVAAWHKNEMHDEHFKVIYICSNINIANQNARKLGISDLMNVSESRLSMQHLKIYQNKKANHSYEQLIPLRAPRFSAVRFSKQLLYYRSITASGACKEEWYPYREWSPVLFQKASIVYGIA